MAFSIAYNITAVDKFSEVASKINQKTQGLQKSIQNLNQRAASLGKSFTGMGKNLSLKVSLPLSILGIAAIKSAASLETLQTSFVGMLGDAEKAKNIVKDLNEFTAKTPFQLGDVAKSARQLLAANVPAVKIKDTLQVLGDISAAANVPLTDMAQIFAKIKNKGKAMTEEILQLSDRGVPIINMLAKSFNVTKDQVFDMASKGKISFKVMQDALVKMTQKGQFANRAMILQSETLAGVISTLKDNVTLMAAEFGQILLPVAKKVALTMITMAQNIGAFIKNNPKIAKLIAIVGAIAAAVGPVLIGLGALATAISFITVKVLTLTAIFSGVGLAIAGLSIGIYYLVKHWETLKKYTIAAKDALLDFIKSTATFRLTVAAINVVGSAFNFVKESIISVVNYVTGIFIPLISSGWNYLINNTGIFGQSIQFLINIFKSVGDVFINSFVNVIVGGWERLINAFSNIGIFKSVIGIIGTLKEGVGGLIAKIGNIFGGGEAPKLPERFAQINQSVKAIGNEKAEKVSKIVPKIEISDTISRALPSPDNYIPQIKVVEPKIDSNLLKSARESVMVNSMSEVNKFEGKLDIGIRDKGNNVENVQLAKFGNLNVGMSGI